jgi:cell division protein FtsB
MKKTANYYTLQKNNKKSYKFISIRMLNIGLFLFVATGFFFYLIGISSLTAKGFILQDLRSQAAELEERHEMLEQQVNSLQSFYVLNEKAKNLDMVKIDNIEYIKAGTQTVAKR